LVQDLVGERVVRLAGVAVVARRRREEGDEAERIEVDGVDENTEAAYLRHEDTVEVGGALVLERTVRQRAGAVDDAGYHAAPACHRGRENLAKHRVGDVRADVVRRPPCILHGAERRLDLELRAYLLVPLLDLGGPHAAAPTPGSGRELGGEAPLQLG